MLGSFNNVNIIILSHKAKTTEDFKKINQVVLDVISDNMDSLVKYGKYGVMNTTYSPTTGYFITKFVS